MVHRSNDEPPARRRTFQCREGLWRIFEDLAASEATAVDHLLEQAMIDYARRRGSLPVDGTLPPERPNLDETQDAGRFSARGSAPRGSSRRTPSLPPAPVSSGRSGPGRHDDEPPPRTQRMPGSPPGQRPSPVAAPPFVAPPAMRTAPIAMPPPGAGPGRDPRARAAPQPPPRSAVKRLSLAYQGRSFLVDQERFLIGRSKTQADLRLDDSNVSRQHAMIEQVDGAWYIVDLGSTNGVNVGGQRVARRALRDGDVLEITTHQIVVSIE